MVLTPQQAQQLAMSGKRFRQIQQEQGLTESELQQVIDEESKLKPGLRQVLARKRALAASELKGPGQSLQEKMLEDRAKIVREVIGPQKITQAEAEQRARQDLRQVQAQEIVRVAQRQAQLAKESEKRTLTNSELRELGFTFQERAKFGAEQLRAQELALKKAQELQRQRQAAEQLISRKKTIDELLGKRLMNKVSREFTEQDLNTIRNAANKDAAIKVIRELRAKQQQAQDRQQKAAVERYLKASVKNITTEKELQDLQKAINKEEIRQQNQKLQAKIKLEEINKKLDALQVKRQISIEDLVAARSPAKATELLKKYEQAKPVLSKQEQQAFRNKVLNTPIDAWRGVKDFAKSLTDLFLITPYEYGKTLVRRGLWSSDIKRNPLLNDAARLIKAPYKISEFVAKNPKTSGILVAVAAANLKLDLSQKFDKEPARVLTRVLLEWYSPTLGLKAAKLTKDKIIIPSKNLIRRVNPNLFKIKTQEFRTSFDVDANLVKGSAGIKLKTTGTLEDGRRFIADTNLRLKEGEAVQGTMKIRTEDGQTFTKQVNLKDEGAFYIDKATGEKIPKTSKAVENVVIKIKETKQGIKFDGDIYQVGGTKVIQKREYLKLAGTSVEKAKGGAIKFKLKPEGVDILKRLKVTGDPVSVYKKPVKNRTPKDYDRALKFLELSGYDTTRLKYPLFELEKFKAKRLALAKELGLTESNMLKLVKGVEQDINDGMIIVRKAKLRASGSFEEIKPQRFAMGPSFLFSKPELIKKGKIDKTLTGNLKVPQEIKIPDLDSLIFLPRSLPKGIKVPKRFVSIAAKLGLLRYYDFVDLTKADKLTILKKLETKLKAPIKKPIKKVKLGKLKIPSKVKVPVKKITQKPKTKIITKKRIPVKKVPSPVPKKPRPRKPAPTPRRRDIDLDLPDISFPSKQKNVKREVLIFEGYYRERKNRALKAHPKKNPVVSKKLTRKTTLNRMLKEVAELADRRAIRSIETRIVKRTRKFIQDINPPAVLNKFTFKKPNSKVLKLVEKSKFALDNPQERKDVKMSKHTKKTKKSPKIKRKPSKRKSKK